MEAKIMTDNEKLINDDDLGAVSGGAMKVIGVASVLVSGLNIRSRADKNSTLMGQANKPAKYDVYEIVQNQSYIWYRIGLNMWIANDGTWVHFTSK